MESQNTEVSWNFFKKGFLKGFYETQSFFFLLLFIFSLKGMLNLRVARIINGKKTSSTLLFSSTLKETATHVPFTLPQCLRQGWWNRRVLFSRVNSKIEIMSAPFTNFIFNWLACHLSLKGKWVNGGLLWASEPSLLPCAFLYIISHQPPEM